MPSTTLQTEPVADAESSNSRPHLDQDDSGGGTGVGSETRSAGNASQMASATKIPPISQTESNQDRIGQTHPRATKSSKATYTQDTNRLEVPESGNNAKARASVETSIWDWNTPLPEDSIGSSSSYHFEPQGELLHQKDQRLVPGEVTIPTAIGDWHSSGLDGTASIDGSLVPRRSIGNSTAAAGEERISLSEQSPRPAKRPSRTMSESGEDVESPMEAQTSAQSIRSDNSTTSRLRSGTEGRPGASRTQAVGTPSFRPPLNVGGGSSGSRRGFSDPGVPMVLPARKVFPIQIGDRLFRLSGASISSDGQ